MHHIIQIKLHVSIHEPSNEKKTKFEDNEMKVTKKYSEKHTRFFKCVKCHSLYWSIVSIA
jgi:hypothetical protein